MVYLLTGLQLYNIWIPLTQTMTSDWLESLDSICPTAEAGFLFHTDHFTPLPDLGDSVLNVVFRLEKPQL